MAYDPFSNFVSSYKLLTTTFFPTSEVFISTGFIDFTGNEILDSFPNDQELSTKLMSYFVQCLSHDESVHMPDGGGYRVFLPHRIGVSPHKEHLYNLAKTIFSLLLISLYSLSRNTSIWRIRRNTKSGNLIMLLKF